MLDALTRAYHSIARPTGPFPGGFTFNTPDKQLLTAPTPDMLHQSTLFNGQNLHFNNSSHAAFDKTHPQYLPFIPHAQTFVSPPTTPSKTNQFNINTNPAIIDPQRRAIIQQLLSRIKSA